MTPVPLWLLTGFLGSGKTTLLRDWLREPEFAGAAVVINELGAVGLDHELLEAVDAEPVLIENGCVCCTVRSNLADTLLRLVERPVSATGLPPSRIVIETTGIADPAPILEMLFKNPGIARAIAVEKVITVVDALHASSQLQEHPECMRQVAVADLLVVTKAELAQFNRVSRLKKMLALVNPHAAVLDKAQGLPALSELLLPAWPPMQADAAPKALSRGGQVRADNAKVGDDASSCTPQCTPGCAPDCIHEVEQTADHTQGVRTDSFVFTSPLDWAEVSDWLASTSYFHGEKILRIKGILNLRDDEAPVAVHGVHRSIDPPRSLEGWHGAERISRVVFITQNLPKEALAPPGHWPRTRIERVASPYQSANPIALPVPASVL